MGQRGYKQPIFIRSMVDIMFIISLLSELISGIIGIALMFVIIIKNRRYLGNIFMGLALGGLGFYTFFVFMYDVIAKPWAIQVFLPIGISCVVLAGLFLYYTFNILSESTKWFDALKNWVPSLVVVILFIIYIFSVPFIFIESLEPPNTRIEIVPLVLMLLILLYFLFNVLAKIQRVALKSLTGTALQRMIHFRTAIVILIIALFVNIPTQLFENMGLLDQIFYIMIAIGEITFGYAFLFVRGENKEIRK
jgi:hypothetical protein